jgi:hypothetical protein
MSIETLGGIALTPDSTSFANCVFLSGAAGGAVRGTTDVSSNSKQPPQPAAIALPRSLHIVDALFPILYNDYGGV